MAKYVIPSITIPAIYSVIRQFYPSSGDQPIRSIDQAVTALNNNKNTQDAIRFIQDYRADATFLSDLTPEALGRLALRGSDLCNKAKVSLCTEDVRENFENILWKVLFQFNLGDEWNSAVAWLNRVACPEEDLACSDEWLTRRPSQVERLHQLLQLLYLKTERSFDATLVSPDVVSFLYSMFIEFRHSHNDIKILSLKTLSNIVLNNVVYAKAVFTSEWLQLLSELVQHGKSLEERLISHKICQNALFTLGVTDYKLNSDVYELYLPDEEPAVDIVMIHGLRGSVGYTWRQNDAARNLVTECWPKDWLPKDINSPIRIIGIDYPSYLIQFMGTMESLQVRADRFKSQLKNAGIGKRPVVFICHSMGGLLAKRLLLDLPELAQQTVGILFIATPHRGSPIAAWGNAWGKPMFHITEDVRFLNERNPINFKLNEDFAKISDNVPVIVSMVETKESELIGTAKGMIVPTQSAVFHKGAVYHIEEVHHNVCKPTERSSPSYGVVLNFLRDSIQAAKKMPKPTAKKTSKEETEVLDAPPTPN